MASPFFAALLQQQARGGAAPGSSSPLPAGCGGCGGGSASASAAGQAGFHQLVLERARAAANAAAASAAEASAVSAAMSTAAAPESAVCLPCSDSATDAAAAMTTDTSPAMAARLIGTGATATNSSSSSPFGSSVVSGGGGGDAPGGGGVPHEWSERLTKGDGLLEGTPPVLKELKEETGSDVAMLGDGDGSDGASIASEVELPQKYIVCTTDGERQAHSTLLSRLRADVSSSCALAISEKSGGVSPMWRLLLVFRNRVGSLAKVTAVLGKMDLGVLEAQTFRTADGFAMCVFTLPRAESHQHGKLTAALQSALGEALSTEREEVQRLTAMLPPLYAISTTSTDRHIHARLLREMQTQRLPFALSVAADFSAAASEAEAESLRVYLVFKDRPGSLGAISLAFAHLDINILEASVFCTADGERPNPALTPPRPHPEPEPAIASHPRLPLRPSQASRSTRSRSRCARTRTASPRSPTRSRPPSARTRRASPPSPASTPQSPRARAATAPPPAPAPPTAARAPRGRRRRRRRGFRSPRPTGPSSR